MSRCIPGYGATNVRQWATAGTSVLAAIGDYLRFSKTLNHHGALTSAELADRAETNERYVREWLGAMASAGHIYYDPGTQRFERSPEPPAGARPERKPDGVLAEIYLASDPGVWYIRSRQ